MPPTQDTTGNAKERKLHLLAATTEIAGMLAGILAEHGIAFDRQRNLFSLTGRRDHTGTVGLLRRALSGPERQGVSVIGGDNEEFPVPRPLDRWWQVLETRWFEKALAEDLFETWFQPIVDTGASPAGSRVIGYECLIRLACGRVHEGAEILEAARARNELQSFDSRARQLAIRSASERSKSGLYFVNFIPSSVRNPEFGMNGTMEALYRSGMHPHNFVFEAVESELAGEMDHLRRIAEYCRRLGFGLALDNAGWSADAVHMVCELQPDYVKLDKALIRGVEHPAHASAVRRLVEVTEDRGIRLVAGGVERRQTMENLWLLGVHYMQGHLFGRPQPELCGPGQDLFRLAQSLGRTPVTVH